MKFFIYLPRSRYILKFSKFLPFKEKFSFKTHETSINSIYCRKRSRHAPNPESTQFSFNSLVVDLIEFDLILQHTDGATPSRNFATNKDHNDPVECMAQPYGVKKTGAFLHFKTSFKTLFFH